MVEVIISSDILKHAQGKGLPSKEYCIAKVHMFAQERTNLTRGNAKRFEKGLESIIWQNEATSSGLQPKVDRVLTRSCQVWPPLNFTHTITVTVFADQLQVEMGLESCQPFPGR